MSELEERLTKIYSRAEKELAKKASSFFERFEEADRRHKKLVEEGKLTEEEYQNWRINALMTGKRYKQMQKDVAETLLNVNKVAASYINDEMPGVYANNFNRVGQDAEQKVSGYSFDLVSAETVKKLATEDTTLLPYKYVDGRKDERWNTKKVNSEILQGIIQGESIPKIAKRLGNVTEMNKVSAIRNARTAVTGAQNSGRFNGMKQLEKDGVILKKEWVAAVDSHTREAHLELNGQQVDVDEPFVVDGKEIMFPGDPECPYPELVYNCRCAIRTVVIGFKPRSENKVEEEVSRPIVQGKDISDNWVRRPDEFQFEIQDVMNAQGFDGLPQLVNQEEFDKAVEQSHFIAQRTYSAPDQETLDAYRDMLYNGEWYVDCSTGGAQYGQGMYCAADYNGQLTDGIKAEMAHYQELGKKRALVDAGNEYVKKLSKDDLSEYLSAGQKITDEELAVFKKLKSDPNLTGYKLPKDEQAIWQEMIDSRKWSNMSLALSNRMDEFDKNFKGFNYTENITLTPGAKIISYKDALDLKQSYSAQNMARRVFEQKYNDDENIKNIANALYEVTGKSFSLTEAREMFKSRFATYMTSIPEEQNKVSEKWINFRREHKIKVSQSVLIWGDSSKAIGDAIDKSKNMDVGSFAAMLGYDAINAEGHGESGSYTVILNRTKCIILNGGLKK